MQYFKGLQSSLVVILRCCDERRQAERCVFYPAGNKGHQDLVIRAI